jgi:hypothetical protein
MLIDGDQAGLSRARDRLGRRRRRVRRASRNHEEHAYVWATGPTGASTSAVRPTLRQI